MAVNRTIDPGINVLTAAEIRVAVLPIGPIPKDILHEYVQVFSRYRHVPLNSTRSFYQEGQKTPFPHLPWKTGRMHFHFHRADDVVRKHRMAPLQAQRRNLAVVGLVHCPLAEDLGAAMEEFTRSSRQMFPDALMYRCCAFEPGQQHMSAMTQQHQELMIFPAGHLDQHLEVYMHEFAAGMLAELENWVLNLTIANIKLSTYMDTGEFTGSLVQLEEGLRKLNVNEEEVKEKKRWGRLQKLKGDVALLAGSPRDAFEHYKSSLDLSKAAGDFIWSGAAMEGLAHARVMEALCTPRNPSALGPSSSRPSMPPVRTSLTGANALTAAAAAITPTAVVTPSSGSLLAAAAALGSAGEAGAVESEDVQLTEAGTGGVPGSSSSAVERSTTPPPAAAAAAAAAVEGRPDTPPLASPSTPASAPPPPPPPPPPAAEPGSTPATPTPAMAPIATSGGRNSTDSVRAGSEGASPTRGGAAPPGVWGVLRDAEILDEVHELFAEARNWYRKKGGAAVLQIEQLLKLGRLVIALAGARPALYEVTDLMKEALQAAPNVHLIEDRLVTLVEAAQLLGTVGCGRKRMLLLWHAMEQSRGLERSDLLTLRIATALLEPPDPPGHQCGDEQGVTWYALASAQMRPPVSVSSKSSGAAAGSGSGRALTPRSNAGLPGPSGASGSRKGGSGGQEDMGMSAANCGWQLMHLAALEAALSAARHCGAAVEAWEAAAALMRCHWRMLPPPYHASLIDALQQAAGGMSRRARTRPGPGPGPWVALKRILPGPPPLQPVALALVAGGAGGGAAQQGPFIFNPYAAKRSAAAAAGAVQAVEWVTGDTCQVEVVLVNPTSVPFKVDLQLNCSLLPGPSSSSTSAVSTPSQPQQQQQQPAAAANGGSANTTSSSSSSSSTARSQAVQPVIAQVFVPTGGKAIKQVLAVTPLRPGLLQVHGIIATGWGTSWSQDFCQLPKSGLNPVPEYNWAAPAQVVVLARLPQLQAHLKGIGVDVQLPLAEDLAPSAASGMTDMTRRTTTVNVFEGQRITWALTLTNVSIVAVGVCQIQVVNQKGQVVKPLEAGMKLPASFTGAHMEVREGGLLDQLPLQSGRALTIPVTLTVGRAPADLYEGVHLELQVTYAAAQDSSAAADASGPGSRASNTITARRLVVPVRFHIQPTLQVTHITLLQLSVPLSGRKRVPGITALNLQDANLAKDGRSGKAGSGSLPAAAAGAGGRTGPTGADTASSAAGLIAGALRFARNSSTGALPQIGGPHLQVPGAGGSSSTEAAAGSKPTGGSSSKSGPDPFSSAVAVAAAAAEEGGVSGATSAAVAPVTTIPCSLPVDITTQPVLEIGVRNVSDRYFRTWVSWLTAAASGPAVAESAVVVLEPGDTTSLLCPLPAHLANSAAAREAATAAAATAAAGGGAKGSGRNAAPSSGSRSQRGPDAGPGAASSSSSSDAPSSPEPVTWQVAPTKVVCAELLSEVLGVMWEMITGDAAPDQLPGGAVQLTALHMARSITPGAMAALCPPALHLTFRALPPGASPPPSAAAAAAAGGGEGGDPLELVDVGPQLERRLGGQLLGMLGPVWGLVLQVGQPLQLQLQLTNRSSRPLQVQFSITWQELCEVSGGGSNSSTSSAAAAAAALLGVEAGRLSWEGGMSFAVRGGLGSMGSGGSTVTPTSAFHQAAGGHGPAQQQQHHPGLFVSGLFQCVRAGVAPQATTTQPLTVMGVMPGVYQLSVSGMVAVDTLGRDQSLYHDVDRLLLLVTV